MPDDLSIAGFDDSELAEYVHPGLTTVRADPFRFGEAAARTLNQLVDGAPTYPMSSCPPRSSSSAGRPLHPQAAPGGIMKLQAGLLAVVLAGSLAACGGSGGGTGDADAAAKARGPITIWYSNNAEEVAWGKQMVAAWNAAHADQKVTAQEIPTGKSSEEVIGAAITAGNAPCLIFNTSPASVPQFQKQGGLVPLDAFSDGKSYIEDRTGDVAKQYKSPDGKYYQLPWKSNPVMIFYNKKASRRPGSTPQPAAGDLRRVPRHVAQDGRARRPRRSPSTRRRATSSTSPGSTSTRCSRPRAAASSWSRTASRQFDSDEGKQVADFWRTMYADKLAPKEKYTGDAFVDGNAAMAMVGPWAIAVVQGQGRLGRRARCRPRPASRRPRSTPSPTRRTSRCTRPARTAAPRGTC